MFFVCRAARCPSRAVSDTAAGKRSQIVTHSLAFSFSHSCRIVYIVVAIEVAAGRTADLHLQKVNLVLLCTTKRTLFIRFTRAQQTRTFQSASSHANQWHPVGAPVFGAAGRSLLLNTEYVALFYLFSLITGTRAPLGGSKVVKRRSFNC